jgi:plasmid stabilization system protein ParE
VVQPLIYFSRDARFDLLTLEDYIAENDGEARAELIVGRILGSISTLAYMPGMGRTRSYLDENVRAFAVPPWLILYTVLPERDGIRVIRVVDSRRDLTSLMSPE